MTADFLPPEDPAPSREGLRVHIVDDDPDIRHSTRALLGIEGYEARAHAGVTEFLDNTPRDEAGCLLLDIRMPDEDGVACLPRLLKERPFLRPVMITAHADVETAVTALKTGALDFLRKPWRRDDLLAAVNTAFDHAAHDRATQAETDAAARLLGTLTPRETDVFEELITGAANKVVARRLGLSPRTVEFHRARIFEKTGTASVAELVRLKTRTEPPR